MTLAPCRLALAFTALLPACTAAKAPPEGTCGARALQSLVGQPATVLETMRLADPVRVLRPNTAATADYNPARTNVVIDGAGKIIRVTCG